MGDDEFCGQKPKVLIQLKKKEKETLWRLTLLCDFGCTFVYVINKAAYINYIQKSDNDGN